jgi:hypothetical protein
MPMVVVLAFFVATLSLLGAYCLALGKSAGTVYRHY